MLRFARRLVHFARWVYRPVHGNPAPPEGDGRVFRMGPGVAWELAGRFADDGGWK